MLNYGTHINPSEFSSIKSFKIYKLKLNFVILIQILLALLSLKKKLICKLYFRPMCITL